MTQNISDVPLYLRCPHISRKALELDQPKPIPEIGDFVLYFHRGERRKILYIGITQDFINRQKAHQSCASWWREIYDIRFELFRNESLLRKAERDRIQIFRPPYNIAFNRPGEKVRKPINNYKDVVRLRSTRKRDGQRS
jgi:excinuclease UvrABC nuclease subunit